MNILPTTIFLCLSKGAFLQVTQYENIRFSRLPEGFTLKQIPGISLSECWIQCEQRMSCNSINYNRRFHMCYLNTENDDGSNAQWLIEAPGFVYKPKRNDPTKIQICGARSCLEGEVCKNNNCEVHECPALLTVNANVNVLGNTFSCGNKLIVRCNEGYIWKTGNDIISSECLDNGTWSSTMNCSKGMKNCKEYMDNGDSVTGIKTIFPDQINPIEALCVMDVDGGGWTVIQKRESALNFYRGWQEYRDGFGDKTSFWLGLENIHRLTAQGNYELRIDMKRPNLNHVAVKYSNFSVGNESTGYKLRVGGYSFDPAYFDPGEFLIAKHNGMKFSTYDNDNDLQAPNCAVKYQAGWWYESCHSTNLNGVYGSNAYGIGISWGDWTGYYESLIYTRLMIRPN